MLKKYLLPLFLVAPVSAQTTAMKAHAFRLKPGQDVYKEIVAFVTTHKIQAASVVSAVGSVQEAHLRFANRNEGTLLKGPLEVLSLSGTISVEGAHIHMSVADGDGKMTGGHLLEGSKVYTTLELVIAEYEGISFKRTLDKTYGYKELDVQPIPKGRLIL